MPTLARSLAASRLGSDSDRPSTIISPDWMVSRRLMQRIKRALAAAARAADHHDIPRSDGEVDVLQHMKRAEPFVDLAKFDHGYADLRDGFDCKTLVGILYQQRLFARIISAYSDLADQYRKTPSGINNFCTVVRTEQRGLSRRGLLSDATWRGRCRNCPSGPPAAVGERASRELTALAQRAKRARCGGRLDLPFRYFAGADRLLKWSPQYLAPGRGRARTWRAVP